MCVYVYMYIYTLKHRKQIQKYFCDLICFRNLSILLFKDRLDPFERTDVGKRSIHGERVSERNNGEKTCETILETVSVSLEVFIVAAYL